MIHGGVDIIIQDLGHGDSTLVIILGMDGVLDSALAMDGLIMVLATPDGMEAGGDLLSITPIVDGPAFTIPLTMVGTTGPTHI